MTSLWPFFIFTTIYFHLVLTEYGNFGIVKLNFIIHKIEGEINISFLLILLSIVGIIIGSILLIVGVVAKRKTKGGLVLGVSIAVFIVGFIMTPTDSKSDSDNKNVAASTDKKKIEKETPVTAEELSLEEQSKQFINENLEGKTIADFTNKLLTVEDEKLVDMIVLGHKNGKQFEDDFDLLGRKATASGVITEFAFESSNIGQKRRREGSTTAVRTDKFTIYMGNKDIENYEYIEYDELIHKEEKEQRFLGKYPEEIINFAIIDLKQDTDLSIGQKVSVDGIIANYVIRKDNSDQNKIDDFSVLINDAVLK